MKSGTKLQASGILVLAKLLGFEILGFSGLADTMGSGTEIVAASIKKDGNPVTGLYVSATACSWADSSGTKHNVGHKLMLRDDGELRVDRPTTPTAPERPTWQ